MKRSALGDDAVLVEACLNKDAEAWAALASKYSKLISASIANSLKRYGFTPAWEDTEDIKQNILASIWADGKLQNVRNRKSIAYWLSIVSGNAAIYHMRDKMTGGNPQFVPIPDSWDIAAINSDTADNKELSEKIKRSIDSLPSGERLVAKLNILHGMGYRDIAEMLNMPTGTVSSYIKRAKEKLRVRLKDFR